MSGASEPREPNEPSEPIERDEPAGPALPQWSGDELLGAVEAILMVTETPVSTSQLATVLGVPVPAVAEAIAALAEELDASVRPRGLELREAGGGWRFYSAPAFAPAVEKFVLDGQTARLTQAALETLAVIAYRQPVSRGRISAIRGVNVDSVVRTLLTRGLIEEAGQDAEGGATLYRTSSYFLERLGLRDLDDLPPLAPYLPDIDSLEDIDGLSTSEGG